MNELQKFEARQVEKLEETKNIPDFQAGDTVRVNVRIKEGANERIQAFEGVCIAKKTRGLNSNFTVRKVSNGEGVERLFPTYSQLVESVAVIRRGDVRRAKLFYMRELTGKKARIKEKIVAKKADATAKPAKEAKKASPKAEKSEEK